MQKKLHLLFIIPLLMFTTASLAQQIIKVGVGNFPPFFIENGTKGIYIEVINEIFKQLPKYKVQYIFMSNHRILHEINMGKSIDVACNVFPSSKIKAFLSDPIFRYRDVAVSKKSAQLTINTISDLQGKSIAAYQGATELLGDKFKKMAKLNDEYTEHAHPKDTTQLILSGIKDIRIGDINIFKYDLNNQFYDKDKNADYENYTVHYLWPDVYSHMAFKDPSLKNDVNEIVKKLKSDGTMEKIYAKYKMN